MPDDEAEQPHEVAAQASVLQEPCLPAGERECPVERAFVASLRPEPSHPVESSECAAHAVPLPVGQHADRDGEHAQVERGPDPVPQRQLDLDGVAERRRHRIPDDRGREQRREQAEEKSGGSEHDRPEPHRRGRLVRHLRRDFHRSEERPEHEHARRRDGKRVRQHGRAGEQHVGRVEAELGLVRQFLPDEPEQRREPGHREPG